MVNQKHKERHQKEARESIKIFLKNKKTKGKKRPEENIKILLKKKKRKGEKRPEEDMKILLKKKKKKDISIIRNLSRSYLSIEEIII